MWNTRLPTTGIVLARGHVHSRSKPRKKATNPIKVVLQGGGLSELGLRASHPLSLGSHREEVGMPTQQTTTVGFLIHLATHSPSCGRMGLLETCQPEETTFSHQRGSPHKWTRCKCNDRSVGATTMREPPHQEISQTIVLRW